MQTNITEAVKNGKFNREMPSDYGNLISQAKYDTIIDIVLHYFKKKPVKILSLEEGVISIKDEEGMEQRYSFFNLVRSLYFIDLPEWKSHIYRFFDNEVNLAAYRFFLNDYEHARQYLRVLLKPAGFLKSTSQHKMIVKEHFPGTLSFLVFNYDQKFLYLEHSHIKEWKMSTEELFAEALYNVSRERMYTKCRKLENDLKLYIMMSHEYSAARMIKIAENDPHMIGDYGALFTIPANGVAFVVPLKDEEAVKHAFKPLMRVSMEAYRIEPSPVILDIFHYYNGEFSSLLDYIKRNHPEIYDVLQKRK